jgi:hypothetical protein
MARDVRSERHHQPAEHRQHERVPHDGFFDAAGQDPIFVGPPEASKVGCNRYYALRDADQLGEIDAYFPGGMALPELIRRR